MSFSGDDGANEPAKGRNHPGDGGPRHQGAEGLRQSAGGPRFHRAVSDRGGSACPSRRIPVWPARHPDHQGAAGSADGARRPAMRRRRYRALGPGRDHHHPARGAEGRRSSPGLRQCLPSDPQFLQRHAGPLRRRDQLFRSPDRRRHRRPVQAQYQGGAGRSAGLAILRNARHSRDRGGRACARRAGDRRQHLGDGAVSPLAGARRRYQHAGRDQIYRRPFRHHVRHHCGQRQGLAAGRRGDPAARRLRRTG